MTPRCKPSGCSGCSLQSHGTDFSQVEGTGVNGVLVVAEASGEHEAREQLPLRPFAPAGQVFERCLRRMALDRKQFAITNVVRCFISPRTSVFTSNGYRDLSSIKQGDLVLTHKGRFMPVDSVLHELGVVPYIQVQIKGKAWSKSGMKEHPIFIRVTPDHRFMSNGAWVFANDLKYGASIAALAEHCIECGTAFHRSFHLTKKNSLPFCSIKCHNTFVARRAVDKIREVMLESYRSGRRDAFAITKAANAAMRKLLESGWRTPRTEEGQRVQRIKGALTRQALGLRGGGWIGFGEKDVAAVLEGAGYDATSQFALSGYNFDFKVGDTLIDVDGPSSQQQHRKLIQFVKEAEAEKAGYKVVHVSHDNPIAVLNLLENDTHQYEFMEVDVVSMENKAWPYGWWSLSVPEDESFVAQGVINHNCRPRNNFLENAPWERSAITSCRPNLDAAIRQYRPRCIVALGGVALRELTGEAGEARGVTHLAGYVLPLGGRREETICGHCEISPRPDCPLCGGKVLIPGKEAGTIPVIADFHPSYLRRGKASHQGVFSRILQRAINIASGRDKGCAWGIDPEDATTWNTPAGKLDYWTRPTLDQCWSVYHYLKDNPALYIAKDIETSESSSLDEDAREGFSDTEVRLFQLSYQERTGIAIPYVNGFKEVVQKILHLPNPAFGHNWDNFDYKVLRACAAREGWKYAPTRQVFDTLDMFHHWQPDLPAHLQFCASFINFPFPWKHLAATDIEFYGICDVDADLRLGKYLEATLKKDGLWGSGDEYSITTGYTGQEREVRPVLAAMEDRGMPLDDAARRRLGAEFDAAAIEIAEWLMPRFPESAKKLDPYKTFPPELKKVAEEDWGKLFKEPDKWKCRCDRENKMDAFNCGKCGRGQEEYGKLKAGKWYRYGQREVVVDSKVILDGSAGEPSVYDTKEMRWCYIPEFNPNSGKQLISYMIAKGHKVPKSKEEDADGKQKDTTASKELMRLAVKTADDFYLKVIEYRGLTKLKGTYVNGFAPAADGCVHTTFTFSTAIAQLGARNPNTTNFPKLKPTPKLAKAMRAMVCAPAGKIITEMDWKSCHVITLGLLAGDSNYTRLGRLDIHSAVAGHFLGHWDLKEILKETDDELMARFKWLKSDPERKRVRDDQAKHAILGIGNGLRAKGLYERYMESFPARGCPVCGAVGKVPGLRGVKNCGDCKGSGKQSGSQIAEAVLTICEDIFAPVFKYQEAQRQEAHERQQLRNPFGHMRRFYEVYRWDGKKGCWGHGDQAEEAVAYRLASVAHSHMRELLKELDRTGLAERYGLFNMVHDSIMMNHDERLAEDVIRDVVPVMTAESKVLPGLWLGVEASQGRRWSEMKECELPTAREAVAV